MDISFKNNDRSDLARNLVVRSNSKNLETNSLSTRPAIEALAELQYAYDYFNERLFEGGLVDCIIVYTRKKRVLGYFAPDRFQRVGGKLVPELALNPTYLALRNDQDSLSTLVHEQAHVWRHYFGPRARGGKPYRTNGYHDMAWVEEMERVGLVPSNTGKPGGKKTGYQMTHYIEDGGPFDLACRELISRGFRISWVDRIYQPQEVEPTTKSPRKPVKKDRIKFTCSRCGLNAWAKPSATLLCGCNEKRLEPTDTTD